MYAQPDEDQRQRSRRPDDQKRRQTLAQKKRADPESHHHNAGSQALVVGKPLGDGGDRRHVSESDPGAADHPVTQVEERDQTEMERRACDQVSAGEHDASGQGQQPGTQPGKHASSPGRRDAQREDGDTESPGGLGMCPADLPDQHGLEETPRVDRAEADLKSRADERDDGSRYPNQRNSPNCFFLAALRIPSNRSPDRKRTGRGGPDRRPRRRGQGARRPLPGPLPDRPPSRRRKPGVRPAV